jgi:hypothetical protein
VDAFGGQDVFAQPRNDGRERHDASPDPIGERRGIDVDAFARIGGAPAVQRLVIQELAHQDHRQQTRAGEAAGDRV